MTEDELQIYAETLYEQAALAAQLAADSDVERQTRVANGLIEKPTYAPWWQLPEQVKQSWVTAARLLAEQAEVNGALLKSL